jgi:hypothetical protein
MSKQGHNFRGNSPSGELWLSVECFPYTTTKPKYQLEGGRITDPKLYLKSRVVSVGKLPAEQLFTPMAIENGGGAPRDGGV